MLLYPSRGGYASRQIVGAIIRGLIGPDASRPNLVWSSAGIALYGSAEVRNNESFLSWSFTTFL